MKPYLGFSIKKKYEIFWSAVKPTEESHRNKYIYVIGPFCTKKGAEFMMYYGYNNPHCQSVDDAERLAKKGT